MPPIVAPAVGRPAPRPPRTAPGGRRASARAAAVVGLLALATAAFVLLAGVRASAATYDVWSCRGPQDEPRSSAAWVRAAAPATAPTAAVDDTCGAGGDLRASLAPGRSHPRGEASLAFDAPAGTRIVGYGLDFTVAVAGRGLFTSGTYTAELLGRDPGPGGATVPLASCSGGPVSGDCAASEPAVRDASAPSLGGLTLRAACVSATCGSAGGSGTVAALRRSRVTLDDPAAPALGAVGGTLGGSATGGARTLTVAASDVGGGVAGITAAIDGGPPIQDDAGGTCVAPFVVAQPCPASRVATFGVATAGLSTGTHTAAGTVADAAGNLTAWGPVPFVVPPGRGTKGTAPGAVAVPGGGGPAVDGRLTITSTRTKGGLLRPSGRLTTAAGRSIAGAKVRLTRTRIGAKRPRTLALRTVTTGRDGRFTAAALPEGAWSVAGSAPVGDGAATATATLRTPLRITAASRPRRLRTGGLAVLSGRLTGAGPARGGAPVRIQVVANGRWRTVAAVRTDDAGRWRWRHRFTKVSLPTLFSFRAVVPQVGTWPWGTATGRAPTVRVDP